MHTIVPYIAAAAAEGFAQALTTKAPRTAAQWVAHCRAAADLAADRLAASDPQVPNQEGSASIRRWLHEMTHGDDAAMTEEYRSLNLQEMSEASHRARAAAFRATMPLLTSRGATRAYIACVADGTASLYFTAAESKTLLYNAQLALAAYRPQAGRKRKVRG